MKRDWVVWLGCFLLFGMGTVWARVPINNNFFVVADIHDLFEIASAIATVVAVCVAWESYNSWKRQVHAPADLELARKLVHALHQYKNDILRLWFSAELAVELLEMPIEPTAEAVTLGFSDFEDLYLQESSAKQDLKSLLLQCRIAWRIDFDEEASALFKFSERCNYVVRNYLLRTRSPGSTLRVDSNIRRAVANHWSWFKSNNCNSYEGAVKYVDGLLLLVEGKVEGKLLRS